MMILVCAHSKGPFLYDYKQDSVANWPLEHVLEYSGVPLQEYLAQKYIPKRPYGNLIMNYTNIGFTPTKSRKSYK